MEPTKASGSRPHGRRLTTIGSVVVAIAASLCCIGPIAAAMIGIGSIAAFSYFWEYRPYLIGLTVVLLGLAFFFTYRKREVVCEDGTCKFESAGKWSKAAVWLATTFAVIAIAFPYVVSTDIAAAQSTVSLEPNSVSALTVAVLEIEGMDCRGCAKGLEATLARLEGVKEAVVEYEQSRAMVEYDSTAVTPEELLKATEETGFKALVVQRK